MSTRTSLVFDSLRTFLLLADNVNRNRSMLRLASQPEKPVSAKITSTRKSVYVIGNRLSILSVRFTRDLVQKKDNLEVIGYNCG